VIRIIIIIIIIINTKFLFSICFAQSEIESRIHSENRIYRTVVSFILYGCEHLILEGSALQVPEDKALKKISGRNTDEINERPTDGLFRDSELHGERRSLSIVRIVASSGLDTCLG
jgi:hypothetical protein